MLILGHSVPFWPSVAKLQFFGRFLRFSHQILPEYRGKKGCALLKCPHFCGAQELRSETTSCTHKAVGVDFYVSSVGNKQLTNNLTLCGTSWSKNSGSSAKDRQVTAGANDEKHVHAR